MRRLPHFILPATLALATTACESNSSMNVESPSSDSVITTPGVSLDRSLARMDSTIVFVNGVRADSPKFNLDFTDVDIEMIRVFRDSAAMERYGSIAEGRIVQEYTVKPRADARESNQPR